MAEAISAHPGTKCPSCGMFDDAHYANCPELKVVFAEAAGPDPVVAVVLIRDQSEDGPAVDPSPGTSAGEVDRG